MAQIDDLLEQAEAQDGANSWVLITKYQRKEFYVDSDRAINVVGRKIEAIKEEVSVQGENHSQYIEFIMDRYYDGIDLAEQTLAIHYEVGDVSDEDAPINVYKNDTQIKFGWVVESNLTQYATTVEFCIWARGTLADGNTYVLKTLPQKYEIQRGLTIAGGIIEPSNNWYTQFALTMDQKVSQASESADRAVQAASSVDGVVETVTTARDEVTQKASTVDTQHSEVESWHQEAEQFRNETEQFRNQAEAIVGIGLAEEGKPGLVQPDGVTTKVDENGKLIVIGGGSGGGGTTDYQALQNKPSIAGIELSGDKSYDELGLASKEAVARNFEAVNQELEALDTFTQQLDQDISTLDTELEQTNQQLQSTTDKVDNLTERTESGFKIEVVGNDIHLTDAVDGKVVDFAMYGKSEQNTTSGKNLFPFGDLSGNGSLLYQKEFVLPIGTYTFSMKTNVSSDIITSVAFLDENLNELTSIGVANSYWNTRSKISINITSEIKYISVYTREEITLSQIQIESGSVMTEYEPYTGGIPSPNPDYPQGIETAGASGSIEVKSCGKNLLNSSGSTWKVGEKDRRTFATIHLKKGVYTFSWTQNENLPSSIRNTPSYMIYGIDSSLVHQNAVENNNQNKGRYSWTIEITEENDYSFSYWVNTPSNDVTISEIQLALGTNTEYEPYKETKSIIPTPNGLPGIKVASGGNYTDENGQQWITDEIVRYADGSGEYIQRIDKLDLSTIIDWQTVESWNNKSAFYKEGALNKAKRVEGTENIANLMSNRFIVNTPLALVRNEISGIGQGLGGGYALYVSVKGITTNEDLIHYFANNESIVYYPLAEPIHTPFIAEQISEIDKLNTFKPITNISNNEQCGMKITYATLQEALMLQEALNGSKSNAEDISNVKEEIVDIKKDLADTTFKVDTIIEKAVLNIENTSSGEDIHVNDSANAKVREFVLYGKAKQNTTTGKNLLPYPYLHTNNTGNGITWTVNNSDGSITANGTATETSYFRLQEKDYGEENVIVAQDEKTVNGYTFSNGGVGSQEIYLSYDKNNKITFLRIGKGITVNNLTFYPMIRLASITDDTWEPYTNGASPNPGYPQEIEVSGESYNLLENIVTNIEKDGLVFIVNEDKSITLSGTSTKSEGIYINNNIMLEDGKYVASLGVAMIIRCLGWSTSWEQLAYKSDGVAEFEADSSKYSKYMIQILYENGKTYNYTIYPMIRKASVKNDRYMPFGVGSVEVKSIGKNLLNQEPFRLTNDGTNRTKNIYVNLPPNKYIFECKWSGNATNLGVQFINEQFQILNADITSGKPVEIPASFNFKIMYMYIPSGDASGSYADVYDIMISAVGGEYEPYKESKAIINGEFAGIKVSSGGNYTDQNGQQWICDEIVKYADGSGEYIQRVVLKNILPSEWSGTGLNSGNYYHYSTVFKDIVKRQRKAICNRYIHKSFWAGNNLNTYIASDGFIYIIDSNYPTHAEWVEFVTENPIKILFELAEPITTPLTAEEIAEIEKLSTFYPITNISNDFDCGMKVSYLADSKNYIDNQLALQAKTREEEMMSMFLLLPDEVQAAMIENDTNNLMSGMED